MASLSALTVDDDLPKAWNEIIKRVNAISNWDLNEGGNATVGQVLAKLNPPKHTKPAVKEAAKLVFSRTLQCVQRFGSIAAAAASTVFGPSQQCFNAISFVISAVQDYDEVFSNITVLMERVSTFMERLQVYLDNSNVDVKLDKRLRPNVYRVLELFLIIMGKSHKLTSGWKGKFKLAIKIGAFGDDDGIRDAMTKFETLIADVTRQEISTIVNDLSEAARNIITVDRKLDQLLAADDKRTTVEQETKDLNAVKRIFTDDDKDRSYLDRQADLWATHVVGTGQWLLDKPSFARWANPVAKTVPLLALKGPNGYGKSYLSSIVAQHLESKHKGDSRVVLAYYYFVNETAESAKETSLVKAVKSLIWQFSDGYRREYLKAVARACTEAKPDFSNLAEVWQRFVTDPARTIESTFYIVLDGIQDLNAARRQSLLDILQQTGTVDSESIAGNVRIFITGVPNAIKDLDHGRDALPIIDLELAPDSEDASNINESDILLVIEDRMKSMDRYNNDNKDPEITGLIDEIKTELSRGVRGDYSALGYKLDDIRDAYDVDEVRKILERAGDNRAEEIAREVKRLDETLSPAQVKVVNRILAWLAVTYKPLTVQQLENVIALGSETSFLFSLEHEIESRYNGLFRVKDSFVNWRTVDIKDFLMEANDSQSKSNGSAFELSEVELVKRVIRTHFGNVFGTDQDVYSRYKFDDFFAQKLGGEDVRIRLNERESAATAALDCLLVLCEKYDDPKYKPMLAYAGEWFGDHLTLVSLDQADPATKQDIGRKLVRLVREADLINAWWSPERMFMSNLLVYDTSLTSCMFEWLQDKHVQKGMPDMPTERQWVIEATAKGKPAVNIFGSIAKIMASRWLLNDDTYSRDGFWWLRGYIASYAEEECSADTDPSIHEIEQVEQWVRNELKDETYDDAHWNALLGQTYYLYSYYTQAIDCYHKALESLPEEWNLHYGLARAHGGASSWTEAVASLTRCLQKKDTLLDSDEKFTKAYWEDMLHFLGEWSVKREEYGAAEEAWREIIDHALTLDNFESWARPAYVSIASVLNKQARAGDLRSMLHDLKDKRSAESMSWLALLLHDHAWNDEFHSHFNSGTATADALQSVTEIYQAAISDIEDNMADGFKHIILRLYLASLKWRRGSREDQDDALTMWEKDFNELADEDPATVGMIMAYIQRSLSSSLLDRAKQAGLSNPLNAEAEEYAKRLEHLTMFDGEYYDSTFRRSKITLARLHNLANNSTRAKSILREWVKSGFELVDAPGSEESGYQRLASVFQAMDDDVNAIAAWGLLRPYEPKDETDDDKNDEAEAEGEKEKKASVKQEDGQTSAGAPATEPADDAKGEPAEDAKSEPAGDATSEPADNATSIQAAEDSSAEADEGSEAANDEGDEDEPSGDSAEDDGKLDGPLNDVCDGYCGVRWRFADDVYICKDCLGVWFDPVCFAKLQAGTLDVGVCGAHHAFIHIPPFDFAQWRATPKDQMWVGGQLRPIKEWLDERRRDWRLDTPSLQAHANFVGAVSKIQKSWRAWRKVAPSAGPDAPRRTPAAPALPPAVSGLNGRGQLRLVTGVA